VIFFKRLDVVTIGGNPKRWTVDRVREEYDAAGEPYLMAELSDAAGKRTAAETSRLKKVGG
jgi:hypothetical protein